MTNTDPPTQQPLRHPLVGPPSNPLVRFPGDPGNLMALAEKLDHIERKVDFLIDALGRLCTAIAEEEPDADSIPDMTLDGEIQGGERDQSQPL